MEKDLKRTKIRRERRAKRVRKPLIRDERLRLSVFRSLKHIYAQIIDDLNGKTLVGVSTKNKEFAAMKNRKEAAKSVGAKLAAAAKEKSIDKVVFDRGRYKFHGRIAAVAEGAREAGLSF